MRNKNSFRFKQFTIQHSTASMKVGTDGVLLGAWTDIESAQRILDVGTGTGVIALMLAQRTTPPVHIDALEISQNDYEQALFNVKDSPWPARIQVHRTSLQDYHAPPYDLIVSNPPFFIDSYKPPSANRAKARHTDTLPRADLLDHSQRLLHKTGTLNLILPETEGNQLLTLAKTKGWHCSRFCTFRSRATKPVERVLLELQQQPTPTQKGDLVLYKDRDQWSDAYCELTREFYLKI